MEALFCNVLFLNSDFFLTTLLTILNLFFWKIFKSNYWLQVSNTGHLKFKTIIRLIHNLFASHHLGPMHQMSQDRDWCISIFALHVNTLIVHECSQLHLNTVFTLRSYHRRSVRRPQNNWSVFLGLGRDWPVPRISCGVMIWNCVHTTSAFPSFSARENKREATWAHVVFNPLPQEKHLHMIITAVAPRSHASLW